MLSQMSWNCKNWYYCSAFSCRPSNFKKVVDGPTGTCVSWMPEVRLERRRVRLCRNSTEQMGWKRPRILKRGFKILLKCCCAQCSSQASGSLQRSLQRGLHVRVKALITYRICLTNANLHRGHTQKTCKKSCLLHTVTPKRDVNYN